MRTYIQDTVGNLEKGLRAEIQNTDKVTAEKLNNLNERINTSLSTRGK